jgi:hypothetical protein
MALWGAALKLEGKTGVEEVERFDACAIMAVRYGLRVVGLQVEFDKRYAKDSMHARVVMQVLEVQNDPPATDDLDDAIENFDIHMVTQLIKATASRYATNAVKRSGDGGVVFCRPDQCSLTNSYVDDNSCLISE